MNMRWRGTNISTGFSTGTHSSHFSRATRLGSECLLFQNCYKCSLLAWASVPRTCICSKLSWKTASTEFQVTSAQSGHPGDMTMTRVSLDICQKHNPVAGLQVVQQVQQVNPRQHQELSQFSKGSENSRAHSTGAYAGDRCFTLPLLTECSATSAYNPPGCSSPSQRPHSPAAIRICSNASTCHP